VSNYIGGITRNTQPLSLDFLTTQTGVAFAILASPGSIAFTALLGGTPVATGTGVVNSSLQSNNFYGFTGGAFDEIQITVSSFDEAMTLDNLQTSVPEPSTLVLLSGSGIVSLVMALRGRKRTA
jgi:hypothetical protein